MLVRYGELHYLINFQRKGVKFYEENNSSNRDIGVGAVVGYR